MFSSFTKYVISPHRSESVIFEVNTISKIDTLAKITNSTLVANIIAETIATFVVAVFLTAKNKATIAVSALKTDGILTENSDIPRHL